MIEIRKRYIRHIVILFGLMVLFTGCSIFKKPQEIRVGILSWPGYEPLALADSLHYYDKEIKIVRFPSVIDVMGAMRNGTIDVASLTIDESMVYAQENPELRAFLVCDSSNGGDGIVATKGITTAAQLKGKRIGAEESSLSSYILQRYLTLTGIKRSDITIVPITYDLQLEAFSLDQVDVMITYNPVKDQLIAQGANLLFDSTKMPGEIVDVLVARESVLKEKQEQVVKLINGWYKSLDYIQKFPSDANKQMAAFENISEETFQNSWKGIIVPNREEANRMLRHGRGSLNETSLLLVENMRTHGLIKKDTIFKHFFTSEFIKMK